MSEEINTRSDVESSVSLDIALLKYKCHPSVLKIKEFVGENKSEFHYFKINIENIENEIKKLSVSKKGTLKKKYLTKIYVKNFRCIWTYIAKYMK